MRILVTGSSGFLGRRLVPRLRAAGHEVVGASIEPAAPEANQARHALDVRDREATLRLVESVAPDRVVHLAGLAHVGESWRRIAEYHAVNLIGAENVFRAARSLEIEALFASSAEVYGAVPETEQPIGEGRPPAPRSPYALTKAAAERLAAAIGGVTVLRCFNLVGAGQARTFALPTFADQLAAIRRGEREPLLAVGNLTAKRDFVHVDAGVAAFLELLAAPAPGEIFNVATGEGRTVAEALAALVALSGLEVEVREDPERLRPVDQPCLVGDGSRLRARGWSPGRHTFAAAIEEIWREALERESAA